MKSRELYTEALPRIKEMSLDHRVWALITLRELLADIKVDQMLAEALGPDYEPMDPRAWRPSTLPPGCETWAEYEARIASA